MSEKYNLEKPESLRLSVKAKAMGGDGEVATGWSRDSNTVLRMTPSAFSTSQKLKS